MGGLYPVIINIIVNTCTAIQVMGERIVKAMKFVWRKITCQKIERKPIVLLVVGLDNSGKSSVVNYLFNKSLLTEENVVPTIGFRTVTFNYKSYSIRLYDIGGSRQIRALWPKYYGDVHGVIYVVDAGDLERLPESADVFQQLVCHELISEKPILFLGNKQDLDSSLNELHLIRCMNVEGLVNFAKCYTKIEICSCYPNKSFNRNKNFNLNKTIDHGFEWLITMIEYDYKNLEIKIKSKEKFRRSYRLKSWAAQSISNSFADSDVDSETYIKPIIPTESMYKKRKRKKRKSLKNIFSISNNRTAPLMDSVTKTNTITTQSMKDLISSISIEDLIRNSEMNENVISKLKKSKRPKRRPNSAPPAAKPYEMRAIQETEPSPQMSQ